MDNGLDNDLDTGLDNGLNNEKVLTVRELAVSFAGQTGEVQAVRGIDLDLYRGKTLAIVGESGSGKSVAVKSLMGLLPKSAIVRSGTAKFVWREGEGDAERQTDLLALNRRGYRKVNGRRIAMVFQDPMTSLNPTMPIGSQVTEGMRVHLGLSKQQAYEEALRLLELVEIPDAKKRMKNYPHQLSGGMRQRVVIAIAISCHPDILICDEPTTALDVTIQAKILETIQDIQRRFHISVIYITHDFGVVAKVADTISVMYAGKIVETGLPDEIFYDPRHPYTWGLLASVPNLDTAGDKLYSIPGSPPDISGERKGDPFAPRNEYVLKIDRRLEPPLFKITDTHYAATWLLHPNAPKIDRNEPSTPRTYAI